MSIIKQDYGEIGGGDTPRQLVTSGYQTSGAISISNLTVGKEYILTLCTNSSDSTYALNEVTISNTTNCTYEVLKSPTVQDISRYEGYSAYKIIPSATSITITLVTVTTIYMLFE